MNNKALIAQYVDTGLYLPKYQVAKLSNQFKKTYIRKRLISASHEEGTGLDNYEIAMLSPDQHNEYLAGLDWDGISGLVEDLTDPKEFQITMHKIVVAKGNSLDDDMMNVLLNKASKSNSRVATEIAIIRSKGNTLTGGNIYQLLNGSKDRTKVAQMVIEVKGDTLDEYSIDSLLRKESYGAPSSDTIPIMIIQAKGATLNYEEIGLLTTNAANPDKISAMIIKAKGRNIVSRDIDGLLRESKDLFGVINLIILTIGKDLDSDTMYNLLIHSNNTMELEKVIAAIIRTKGNFFPEDIDDLMEFTDFPNKVKALLRKAGH